MRLRRRVWVSLWVCVAVATAGAAPVQDRLAFLQAAEEVLEEVSQLLQLPVLHPLKKSIRSKQEIHAYLVKEQAESDPAKRYADARALEAFGLVPPGFDLQGFLLRLLTNQVAGLYDPKAGEFYIADWIPLEQQRIVMAHELTHALEDQHFHLRQWMKAARPNDDAEAARQAVVEGSAVVAMLEEQLHRLGRSAADLPELGPLASVIVGEAASAPDFAAAPPYLRAALLFPYLEGAAFCQAVLKAQGGWKGFWTVFKQPPRSTREILHPEVYLNGDGRPLSVVLPRAQKWRPEGWRLLDENVAGEFNLRQILEEATDPQVARSLAAAWRGDRYAVLEQSGSRHLLLVWRLRFRDAEAAGRFVQQYPSVWKKKFSSARPLVVAERFARFALGDGEADLWCPGAECIDYENGPAAGFERLLISLHWPTPTARSVAEDSGRHGEGQWP